jgi:nucleobase:cation symporter-1, NCS1 family
VVALYGHATIVYSQRILTYGLAAGMVILGYFVLSKANYGTWVVEPVAAKTPFSTWLLGLEVMLAGSAFSWYNYPCDYSRYQRPDASSKAVATWTALGAAIPAIFISTIGVAAATSADLTDPIAGLKSLVPTWFFIPLLLVIVGGAIANNFLNTYTSSLSLLALGLRIERYKTVFIDMTVATVVAVYAIFISDLTTTLINFFSLMVLWIAPWVGVYFADILLRRNSYNAAALHQVGPGPYWYSRGWNLRALVAFVVGVGTAFLFANAVLYRGPLVEAIQGADISVFVGVIVSFVLYLALMRGRAERFEDKPVVVPEQAAPEE